MCRMDRLSFLSCFDVNRSTFDEDKLEQDFYIFVPSGLDLSPLELNILSRSYSCPVLCFHKIRSFAGFSVSRKSEARDGRTDMVNA